MGTSDLARDTEPPLRLNDSLRASLDFRLRELDKDLALGDAIGAAYEMDVLAATAIRIADQLQAIEAAGGTVPRVVVDASAAGDAGHCTLSGADQRAHGVSAADVVALARGLLEIAEMAVSGIDLADDPRCVLARTVLARRQQ